MVVLSQPPAAAAAAAAAAAHNFTLIKTCKATNTTHFEGVPVVDLSHPDHAKNLMVKACQDFGFFKVVNHGISKKLVSRLEDEAVMFFNLSVSEKEKFGRATPFGYGNKTIGPNGDVGWIEYLLLSTNPDLVPERPFTNFPRNSKIFSQLLQEYMQAMRKLGCEILELMADGLKIKPRDVLSRMLSDEKSDSVFRVNHYPPCPPQLQEPSGCKKVIGFGEHTDPQLISIGRSNTTSGFQICLRDGTWVAVPPDHSSFFINVDDLLQVMTNGRFRSVRHRVVADSLKSRVSMIYFGGPPLLEKIAPLRSLMQPGEETLYNEFTWSEYKSSAYKTRLSDNRLSLFYKSSSRT